MDLVNTPSPLLRQFKPPGDKADLLAAFYIYIIFERLRCSQQRGNSKSSCARKTQWSGLGSRSAPPQVPSPAPRRLTRPATVLGHRPYPVLRPAALGFPAPAGRIAGYLTRRARKITSYPRNQPLLGFDYGLVASPGLSQICEANLTRAVGRGSVSWKR